MALRSALARRLPLLVELRQELRARRRAALLAGDRSAPRPLLVYQMGKVGSASVLRTLEQVLPERPALHVHFLSREGLRAGPPSPERRLGRALRRRIDRLGDALRCDVVTLVRDPIARQVSAVFQNPGHAPVALRGADGRYDVARTQAYLLARLTRDDACRFSHEWFDRELRAVFGVDVFAHPFDRARGFSVIRSERADVLVLRTEDLDRTLLPGLGELLGIDPGAPPPVRHNERAATEDAADYAAVKAGLRLDRSVCERIYAQRFARHFYGEAMLAEFTRRWGEGEPARG